MKTRVALITEIIAPYRIPVFNALAREFDVNLHVIFLSETDPSLRRWPIYKDEIEFSYEVLPNWRKSIGGRSVLINWGLAAALNRLSPEAIVCGGYNYVASWQAQSWARRKQVPFFAWMESTIQDARRGFRFVEALKAKFLQDCAAVIVAGQSSMKYVESFDIAVSQIFLAPDAVDNELFARLAKQARESHEIIRARRNLPMRYFLFTGRLVPEKGVFDLLEAYAGVPDMIRREVGLAFVGDGVARAELEARAREISVGEIRFVGFAQREELAETYALADALVFPTHSDPWGLVVNEAMACGLPVIATDVAGCVPDLVEDRWNGRVIAKQCPKQLTQAMIELAQHPNLGLLGRRSLQRIQLHSPELCAAGFAEAIHTCCGGDEKQAAGASA